MTDDTMAVTYRTLADLFEQAERADGAVYWRLKEDRPWWAADFIREAHGTEMMPDDYRYRLVLEALEVLAEQPDADPDELADEFAGNTDVYSRDLLAWVGSHPSRALYVDEAQGDGLVSADATLDERLAVGQYVERREVFMAVVEAAAGVLTDGDAGGKG